MLSPFYFCGWWFLGTGQPLPGCLGNWWFWGALRPAGPWWWWDRPGLTGPITYRRVGQPGQETTLAPGVEPQRPAVGRPGVGPGPGQLGQPDWAGLGQFQPSPLPGAQFAAPAGPAGPLGTRWAEQAGPGIPLPYVIGPGVPGAPVTPVSPGEAGAEIGPEGGAIGPEEGEIGP